MATFLRAKRFLFKLHQHPNQLLAETIRLSSSLSLALTLKPCYH
jgi:hypothetical protein